ncbi:MAG: tetratricopeptide repeat protein, partial [Candidatus Bathyarchaeota archaeon]|nr:tetratricopeptide repeat protein [Candidatus Bathyarchaeota archaeon]
EETIFSMSRDDLLTRMELDRLGRNDFPALVRSIFGSSLGKEFVEKLYGETEGNPLFASETLSMLVEEGHLREKDGRWVFSAPKERIRIPSKVREVIVRRISKLGTDKRKLLDVAAVSGYHFAHDTLCRVLTLDPAVVLAMLAEIEQRHRLIRSVDSAFEFAHHKIREVIYGDMPEELRRIYHVKIADCLEKALAEKISDSYMADMVLHSIEGGLPEKAFEYLIRLGEKAVEISANTEAMDYLNKALEATRTTASLASSGNLARIYKARGRAWIGQGEAAKAVDDFSLLLPYATSLGDESILTESYFWLGEALTMEYKWTESKRNFVRAIEMARKIGNKLIECRSLASLGWSLLWDLDTLEESRIRLEESSKISRKIGDRVADARSRLWLGFFYNWRGEFNLAKENINEALKLFEELGDRFHVLQALVLLGWVNCGKGEYNDAILASQRCLQLARKWDIVYWDRATMPLTQLGWIHRDLSNIELALQYDREALENAEKFSVQERRKRAGTVVAALVDLGMDYLHRNDYENAEKHFKEVASLISLHPLGLWRIEVRSFLGFAEIALAKGDFQNALKSVEDALVISEKAGARKYIAQALKLKAETLTGQGRLEEAIELMENALKRSKQVGNPTQLWQIHYSFGLLEEKHRDARKANEHYAKAIALIEAVASQLNDVVLKSTLLTSQKTRAVRDAYSRTASVQERVVGLERFEHAYLQAALAALDEVTMGETFEVRLDITNAAKEPAVLVRVEFSVPSNFKITRIAPKYELKDSAINLKGKCLEPKKVESIKISAVASESGMAHISPRIVYVDELGKFKTCQPDPITVAVYPPGKFQFKTNNAERVFEFLTKAFVEDYMRRRLSLEKSGWRTLVQIAQNARVPRSSVYGTITRRGTAISELERRGIVELRTFSGERGRGGNITRARVAYGKDIVKRYVDQQVMKIVKK